MNLKRYSINRLNHIKLFVGFYIRKKTKKFDKRIWIQSSKFLEIKKPNQ